MRALGLVLVLVAAACGSSSSNGNGNGSDGNGSGGGTGDGGGNGNGTSGTGGGSVDLSIPPDLSTPPDLLNAFVCGSTVCSAGLQCCIVNGQPSCAASCPDAGIIAECSSPKNCGGLPCCINIGAGFAVESVTCGSTKSDCPPVINGTTQSGKDRACTTDADCTDGVTTQPQLPNISLPDCCTNTGTGQHVCFNKLATVQGWTCP